MFMPFPLRAAVCMECCYNKQHSLAAGMRADAAGERFPHSMPYGRHVHATPIACCGLYGVLLQQAALIGSRHEALMLQVRDAHPNQCHTAAHFVPGSSMLWRCMICCDAHLAGSTCNFSCWHACGTHSVPHVWTYAH
jgi:hypothetical protein